MREDYDIPKRSHIPRKHAYGDRDGATMVVGMLGYMPRRVQEHALSIAIFIGSVVSVAFYPAVMAIMQWALIM
jgi:hypothetical protein